MTSDLSNAYDEEGSRNSWWSDVSQSELRYFWMMLNGQQKQFNWQSHAGLSWRVVLWLGGGAFDCESAHTAASWITKSTYVSCITKISNGLTCFKNIFMLPEVVFMSSNTMLCMQKRDLRGSKKKNKQIVGLIVRWQNLSEPTWHISEDYNDWYTMLKMLAS